MTVEEYNKSVDLYSDGVYRFILKNLKDENEAKDIVQDTYEKLWLKASDVSFLKAKPYLFSTAYHTMIDKIRKNKRITNMPDYDDQIGTYSGNYTGLNEVLDEALGRLSEIQRSVILLRDYEGYHYDEIAKITNLTESQVKVYIYRGRVALKKYLGSIEALV